MKAVIYSTKAEADLEAIADYIAQDSPPRAVTFVAELRLAATRIAGVPRGSPLVTNFEDHGLRRRPYQRYNIYYRVGEDAVEIARILHQARDQAAALGQVK